VVETFKVACTVELRPGDALVSRTGGNMVTLSQENMERRLQTSEKKVSYDFIDYSFGDVVHT